MTKEQAKNKGFCKYCAAFFYGRQLCGLLATDKNECQLDAATVRRWRGEHGIGENDSRPVRRVWIKNGFRLARAVREIRRGKNKGKFEVGYLKGTRLRKVLVAACDLKII